MRQVQSHLRRIPELRSLIMLACLALPNGCRRPSADDVHEPQDQHVGAPQSGPPSLSEQALEQLRIAENHSLDMATRIAATQRLGSLGEKDVAPRLAALLPGQYDGLTKEIVDSLAKLADSRALPALNRMVKEADVPVPGSIWASHLFAVKCCERGRHLTEDGFYDLFPRCESVRPVGSGLGFFGLPWDKCRRIVYVLDRSGSMTDSIDFVKAEVKRSIGQLPEEAQFNVIFFSSGPPIAMQDRQLARATVRDKASAFEFVDGVDARGETDPSDALKRAFALNPELIYLLTDGELDGAVADLVGHLNLRRKVTLHAVAFVYPHSEQVLKQIARENGGRYRFVSLAEPKKERELGGR